MDLKTFLDRELSGRLNIRGRRAVERIFNDLMGLDRAGLSYDLTSLISHHRHLYQNIRNRPGGYEGVMKLFNSFRQSEEQTLGENGYGAER